MHLFWLDRCDEKYSFQHIKKPGRRGHRAKKVFPAALLSAAARRETVELTTRCAVCTYEIRCELKEFLAGHPAHSAAPRNFLNGKHLRRRGAQGMCTRVDNR
jgi:hypothetical protein